MPFLIIEAILFFNDAGFWVMLFVGAVVLLIS